MDRQKKRSMLYTVLFLSQFLNSRFIISANEIRCSGGFQSNADKVLVSSDRINDNYCDCPVDGGIDEPNTDACSGVIDGGWAGIDDASKQFSPLFFQCRTHTKQRIPLSRLNDGICDCCDGSDEVESKAPCKNTCDEIMAKENLAKKRIQEEFQLGNEKLNREVAEFQALITRNHELIQDIQSSELLPLQNELQTLETSIQEEKLQFMDEYFQKIDLVYEPVTAIIPGDTANLKMLIEAACHLQGEMTDPTSAHQDSCIALRLAGLDAGIIWEGNQGPVSIRKVTQDDNTVTLDIFNLIANSTTSSQPAVTSQGANDHPRRTPALYETNHYDDDDYKSNDDDDDEDVEGPYDTSITETHNKESSTSSLHQGQDDDSLISMFKVLRRPFYLQAKRILHSIKFHMEQAKGETEETKVDSSELQMIHDNISRKIRQIELGITFSTSARKLLQSLEESEDVESFQYDLVNLAIGTIYHSLIRGVDIVAIVSMYDFDLSKATDTCVLPNMVICPPKTKSYNHLISGTSIIFPPESLLVDASVHCQIQQSTSYDELCKPQDGSMLHHGEIVGSIKDGYFDYFEHYPRDGKDFFTSLFSGMEGVKLGVEDIKQKQSQVQALKQKIEDVQKRIHDLEQETVDKNYGPDGVLFALRNQCFDLKHGKYIYEVCVFGNAYQREDHGDEENRVMKGTGTSLGRWFDFSSDEENARKIMKWTDGTGCWNGPSRTATVYISCGSETVLLSADEPSTCEYVLTMQSHIACDDFYKHKHCSKLSAC